MKYLFCIVHRIIEFNVSKIILIYWQEMLFLTLKSNVHKFGFYSLFSVL